MAKNLHNNIFHKTRDVINRKKNSHTLRKTASK